MGGKQKVRIFSDWLHLCLAAYQPSTRDSVVALNIEPHREPQLRSESQCVKERLGGPGDFRSWDPLRDLVMGKVFERDGQAPGSSYPLLLIVLL